MKKIIIMGAFGIIYFGANAQNINSPIVPNTYNGTNNINGSLTTPNSAIPGSINNGNYNHTPNYYQAPTSIYSSPSQQPGNNQLPVEQVPINNNTNNNTMTPFNNTTSPYDVTSPYTTPPNTNAPLNNIPPIK